MAESGTLTEQECLDLLRSSTIGRFGVVLDGYPVVLPVNYAMDGNRVTFRTASGGTVDTARHDKVSFQVDQVVTQGRSAWSVLVLGAATVPDVGDPQVANRLAELGVAPLDPGDKPLWIQVVPRRITGRSVVAEDLWLPTDSLGYL